MIRRIFLDILTEADSRFISVLLVERIRLLVTWRACLSSDRVGLFIGLRKSIGDRIYVAQ